MPDSVHPKMAAWLNHLTKTVSVPDENCYFVGHSLGCITILRYLESLPKKQKIGGAVLVAGFTSDLGFQDLSSFFTKSINWAKIKLHCKKFVAIHSDDDPWVSLHYADFFKKELNAEIIIEHNMKHFSGDDGLNEFPAARDAVLKLSQ